MPPDHNSPASTAVFNVSYKVRDLLVSPGLVLAPMSGVTSRPFRRLIKELNPSSIGLIVTEFVSVEALTRKIPRSLEAIRYSESERPICIQIFGYDIARMRDGAKIIEDAGADVIDVNCGCPAPKVVRKGGGCELMRQPEHLRRVLAAIRQAIGIPLTLKMRSGYDTATINCIEIAKIAESEGVDALAVHGRTRSQMYRGRADWQIVQNVAAAVSIPVVGSGDIVGSQTASCQLFNSEGRTGVAGIMIGRGALHNPLIFDEICNGRLHDLRRNPGLVARILSRYAQLLEEDFPPKVSIGRIKQLASQMCRGYPWRMDLLRAASFQDQRAIIDRLRELDSTAPLTS